MNSEKINKKQTIINWAGSAENSGSTEAQIGLITERVRVISAHIVNNHKDHSSRRGLLKLIGQRRRLIKYLARCDEEKAKDFQKRIKTA
jgi:small subunit ribosomal protein S15